MPKLTEQLVETYLEKYGWTFHPSDEGVWQTGWQGEMRSYPLSLALTDTWLSLQVAPLMRLGIEWDAWPELSRFLLELNNDCTMVKIGIDEVGELTLSMQLFSSHLSFEEFSDALGIIGYYAEKVYDDLEVWLEEIGYHVSVSRRLLT